MTVDVRPAVAAPDAAPAALEPRLHAFAIDRALDVGLPLGVGWALAATGQGAGVVVAGVLGTVVVVLLALAALAGTRGTSPGYAATGLRLVGAADLAPVGLAPALRRQAVLVVAGVPTFGLGWATLAWTAVTDPEGWRRGWHDQLAGAVLVDPTPAPVAAPAPELPQQIVNLTALRLAPADPEPVRARPSRPAAASPTSSDPATGTPPSRAAAAPAYPSPVASAAPTGRAPAGAAPTPAAPATPRPGRRRAGVPLAAAHSPAAQPLEPTPPTRATPAPAAAAPAVPADPAAQPAVPAAAGGPARWRVRLDTGEDVVVEGLTLLGRGPEARTGESVSRLVPLRSADMSVSKTHAQLQVAADGSLVVMDRGSTNGSVVVRRGVPRHLSPGRPTTLLDGDVVRLGDRTLEVGRAV